MILLNGSLVVCLVVVYHHIVSNNEVSDFLEERDLLDPLSVSDTAASLLSLPEKDVRFASSYISQSSIIIVHLSH